MMLYIRYFIIGLLLLAIQIVIVPLIAIEKIVPDLMIIFTVYVALKRGQIPGTLAGFISGLFMDLTINFVLGLSALSKTVAGFVAGYFYSEAKTSANTETLRFLGIVIFVSMVDNVVYFFIYIFCNSLDGAEIVKTIIGKTIYTSILSLIPVFITSKETKLL
ncbi:MAG: rod shape-determining protein MreD [Candidatus Kryptonium sp.]